MSREWGDQLPAISFELPAILRNNIRDTHCHAARLSVWRLKTLPKRSSKPSASSAIQTFALPPRLNGSLSEARTFRRDPSSCPGRNVALHDFKLTNRGGVLLGPVDHGSRQRASHAGSAADRSTQSREADSDLSESCLARWATAPGPGTTGALSLAVSTTESSQALPLPTSTRPNVIVSASFGMAALT